MRFDGSIHNFSIFVFGASSTTTSWFFFSSGDATLVVDSFLFPPSMLLLLLLLFSLGRRAEVDGLGGLCTRSLLVRAVYSVLIRPDKHLPFFLPCLFFWVVFMVGVSTLCRPRNTEKEPGRIRIEYPISIPADG